MLKVLDLFSGIGGFSMGLERTGGFETVAFCEQDEFCQRVLAKHWPGVPIHDDIRTFEPEPADVVCGGFPCQPFSHAGQRRGAEDDRHLWPQMARIVDVCRPSWVIGENVAGLINMGLDDVLSDLEALGYTARPFTIPACAVDAPHRRDRVWIVGHANGQRTAGTGSDQKDRRWSANRAFGTSAHDGHANGQGQPARPIHAEAPGMPGDVADADRGLRNWRTDEQERRSEGRIAADRTCETVSDPRRRSGEGTGPSIGGCEIPAGREPRSQVRGMAARISEKLDGDLNGQEGKGDADKIVRDMQGSDGSEAIQRAHGRCGGVHETEVLFSEMRQHGTSFSPSHERWLQGSGSQDAGQILQTLRNHIKTLRSSCGRGLEEQQSIEFDDALQSVSYVLASQTGRYKAEERKVAVQNLWEAILQIGAVQHTSDQIAETWESLTYAEMEWCLMAACLGPWWTEWAGVPRTSTGIPNRVQRLRALGNSVVPQVVEQIGRAILAAEQSPLSSTE